MVDALGDPLPPGAVARLGSERFRQYLTRALVFAPGGEAVYSAGSGGVACFDAADGRVLRRVDAPGRDFVALALAPGGRLLAAAERNPPDLRLFDAATGVEVRRLERPRAKRPPGTERLAFSPDGATLASGCADGTVSIWDVATGEESRRLGTPSRGYGVRFLAFRRDGRSVLAFEGFGADGLSVWSLPGGRRRRPKLAVKGSVSRVAYAPEADLLVVAETLGTILCTPDGREVRRFGTSASGDLACSADARVLAVGWSSCVNLVDGESGRAIREIARGDVSAGTDPAIACSRDGATVAVATHYGFVKLWDTASGESRPAPGEPLRNVDALAFHPGGARIASSGGIGDAVRLWDAKTGVEERRLLAGRCSARWLAFSPDGRRLAGGGNDWTAALDPETGAELWSAHLRTCRGAFSPDGSRLAVAVETGEAGNPRLLDAASGAVVRSFAGHGEKEERIPYSDDATYMAPCAVTAVAWSPDGALVASLGEDGHVRLWDAADGALRRAIAAPRASSALLAFAAGGRLLLATGAGEVEVWDPRPDLGAVLREPGPLERLKTGRGRAFAVSPDGTALAAAIDDGTIGVFALAGGDHPHASVLARRDASPYPQRLPLAATPTHGVPRGALLELLGGQPSIRALAFSPDGRLLASGSYEGTALVWALPDPSR